MPCCCPIKYTTRQNTLTPTLNIDLYFDLICPWCLIGKRHLSTALEQFHQRHPNVNTSVVWHAHQLLPDMPVKGMPYQAFYEHRLGSKAAVTARRAQVQAAAQAAGITLAFERIEFMPNTLAAHQLIDCAGKLGNTEQVANLIERLFTAYFMDGRDIGDLTVLFAIATETGFPAAQIQTALATPEIHQRFLEKLAATAASGISGVPCFVFNNRQAISGAHPPASLLAAMEEAPLASATQTV